MLQIIPIYFCNFPTKEDPSKDLTFRLIPSRSAQANSHSRCIIQIQPDTCKIEREKFNQADVYREEENVSRIALQH